MYMRGFVALCLKEYNLTLVGGDEAYQLLLVIDQHLKLHLYAETWQRIPSSGMSRLLQVSFSSTLTLSTQSPRQL